MSGVCREASSSLDRSDRGRYLLPVFARLKAEEFALDREALSKARRPGRPRALVLVAGGVSIILSTGVATDAVSLDRCSKSRLLAPVEELIHQVPTRELAAQVMGVAKDVAHVSKLSVRGVFGGSDGAGSQRRKLSEAPADVLVATPGRLQKLWDEAACGVHDAFVPSLDERHRFTQRSAAARRPPRKKPHEGSTPAEEEAPNDRATP